jgi:hypothetical protein
VRTSERGAGTRHAPYRQASHISSQDQHSPVPRDRGHLGLAENEFRALLRVVRVHRNVSGPHRQHRQDRDVELGGAGGDPDAHPVAYADSGASQAAAVGVDLFGELAVAQHVHAVVDGGGVGMGGDRLGEDVEQGPLARTEPGPEQRTVGYRGRERREGHLGAEGERLAISGQRHREDPAVETGTMVDPWACMQPIPHPSDERHPGLLCE